MTISLRGAERRVCVAPGIWVIGRAIRVRRERLAWSVIGAGLLLWGIGNLYYLFFLHDPIPIPSPADGMWIAFYLLSYTGLVLLMRGRVSEFRASAWLDGMIGATAIAAVATAIVFDTVLRAVGGSRWAVATNLTYPLADGVLIALVVVVLAASGWVAGRAWAMIAIGFAVFAVSDSFYLYQSAVGSYAPGRWVDIGWPLGMLLVAYAASMRPADSKARLDGITSLVLPVLFGLGACGLLVYDHFERLNIIALVLACLSVLGVVARMGLAFVENQQMLTTSRHEAGTDILTGLPNRRRLILDLECLLADAEHSEPRLLVLFDLNGFKHYNDTFGHAAGDSLLARLGARLADAAAQNGAAYRMGGDEFCVLAPLESAPELIAHSLCEEGLGFSVTASFGTVMLPQEALTVSAALTMADDRMYAHKTTARESAGEQSSNVLIRALAERDQDLGDHLEDVAELAVAVGVKLGLRQQVRISCVGLRGSTTSARWRSRSRSSASRARSTTTSGSSSAVTRSSASESWRRRPRSGTPARLSAAPMSASTEPATPIGSPVTRSPSARGSSPSATRSMRWSRTGPTAGRWRSAKHSVSSRRAPAPSSTRPSSRRSSRPSPNRARRPRLRALPGRPALEVVRDPARAASA